MLRVPSTSFQVSTGRVARHPWYFAIALGCCCFLAATAGMVWQQRVRSIERTGTNLQNLAQAVADQTDRVIASIDAAGTHLLGHIATHMTGTAEASAKFLESEDLHATMRDIVAATPESHDFILVDASGRLLNLSHAWPAPKINLADRPYFGFARAHPEIESFVSDVTISRYSGRPILIVVRRLSGPDGTFRGVLLVAIQVDYLERLFGASKLSDGGSVELFQPDGSLLARYPPVPLEPVHGLGRQFRALLSSGGEGVSRHMGVNDHVEHLTAVGRVSHHLMVAVTERLSDTLADWQVEAAWIGTIALLGCWATGTTIVLAVRRLQDQQRLDAAEVALKFDDERRRTGQQTADQHAVFRMALDNMSEGLLMFDPTNRLLLANAAVLKLFQLEPGSLLPGMAVNDVIAVVGDAGTVSVPLGVVVDFYRQLVQRNRPAKFIRDLPDGRRLAGNFAPHDNGWIITYEDMTEARKADERVAHMAHHDALTGLPNRLMLRAHTEAALAAAVEDGRSLAVICLDLDHFKDVNDTLGHPAGDKLLCEVASRIRSVIRPLDLAARLGGDEFAVVLSEVVSQSAVANLATRLVETISIPYELDGQLVIVGASAGIAIAPADGADPDTLMKNADMALYRAKSEGRRRFSFFEPAMEHHLIERHRVGRELHNAMSAGELDLYYQPIVRTESRRIVGFEALMRWHHPTRGTVPPAEFIGVAEDNGLIVELGKWVLLRACRDAIHWPAELKVAVNLSPVQFRSGRLIETVAEALGTTGLAPSRLELEVTESTMMIETDATLATLNELRSLGVRIAMDDFGTGYSSLAYLQKYPFDKIKIDRAFVRDVAQPTNLAIVRAVTGIAESMGVITTAEGVETEEQFAAVEGARCSEVQGYLFGRPRPANEIAALLAPEEPALANAGEGILEDATA